MDKIPLIKKRDAVIIVTIAAISAVFLLFQQIVSPAVSAEITFSGENPTQISLSEDKIFTINGIEFQVKDKKICVKNSPCGSKICVRTGWIGTSAEIIACVPEKMTVRITGNSEKIDVIVG
ncbi:MAG: NusG domain II-containing protein [Oscillospiraceae bacterium]